MNRYGEQYHFSTDTPFVALCGQRTSTERNGHALTCDGCLVECKECHRIRTEQQMSLPYAERNGRLVLR